MKFDGSFRRSSALSQWQQKNFFLWNSTLVESQEENKRSAKRRKSSRIWDSSSSSAELLNVSPVKQKAFQGCADLKESFGKEASLIEGGIMM